MRHIWLAAFLCACHRHDADSGGIELEPPPPGEGFQVAISTDAPPFSEVWRCQVSVLPTTSTMPIHRVESRQTDNVHHMDIMALGLITTVDIPEGMHDCAGLYADYPELMEQGIFLYASQRPEEELILPDGVAALVPGNLKVMTEVHYVNAGDEAVHIESKTNAWAMPASEVTDNIWGSAIRDQTLNIPAGATDHVEWTRCAMNEDIDLVFVASHTHQLAKQVDIYRTFQSGGEELIYTNLDWHSPEILKFEPLVRVPKGDGFRFECLYENPGDTEVNWGFLATDEMCQMAIVHTPGSFSAACEVVQTSDGLGMGE